MNADLRKFRKSQRDLIRKGRQVRCGICTKPIEAVEEFTVDHITPKSLGGSSRPENLQPAHQICNRYKGDGTPPYQKALKSYLQRISV